MASMFDSLWQVPDSKAIQRNAASISQRGHLRESNGVAPPPQLTAEIARMKAEVKAVKDKGKDQWKRSTQRGTQIYGQMKAKLQGHLGQLGSSSSSLGRAMGSSTGNLSGADEAMDVTPVLGQGDPKISCLCDLGISKAVAELALQQPQVDSINDALDWVYNPANSAMVEKAAVAAAAEASTAAPTAPLAVPATAAQVTESPARAFMASCEESKLMTTPRQCGQRVSLTGRAPRVSNDGFGLGMGMGCGRGSRGRISLERRKPASPKVKPLRLSGTSTSSGPRSSGALLSPAQSAESDDHQVLYSARGSKYRVRADSLERLEPPADTSSSTRTQDDDDETSQFASDEDQEEDGEEEENAEDEVEEEEIEKDEHEDKDGMDDSACPLRRTPEDDSEMNDSGHTTDGDDILFQPDNSSWDWPLSRSEKKMRLQLIEQRMHQIDRRTLLQQLESTRGKLRRQSAEH